ncbi:solute carrier family 15 member 3 [Rhea pennata]|uniref:solute carrier family 15 member 3 n=1 Tax=Rhea pennata TaxID=8795 RepID=UPI002E2580A2
MALAGSCAEPRPLRAVGRARDRSPLKGRWEACMAVLVVESLERAAFFGITANLVLYLNSSTFNWGGTQASPASLLFLGASYLLSPVGGWLADVYLGRYSTMPLSFLLYLLAACLLPTTASLDGRLSFCGQMPSYSIQNCSTDHTGTCPGQPQYQYCAPLVYSDLLLLALGISPARPTLPPSALTVTDRAEDTVRCFFNWFYWSINIRAVFALLVVAFIQQNISFLVGYLIPVACLALALLIFLLATPAFVTKPPTDSQVSVMIKLAFQSCGCTCLRDNRASTHWSQAGAGETFPNSRPQLGAPSHEEDLAKFHVMAKILPVMLTFIPYWMVYFQVRYTLTYYLQGLHLHIPSIFQHSQTHASTNHNYLFPDAWLLLASVAVLLALVPLKDRVIDPFLLRQKLLPSALKQMSLGMFFGLASILAAGVLERERLQYVHHNRTVSQYIGKDSYVAASLPIWWQIPQYLFIGISELFASIPGLEFAYSEAPKSMKGATMGLFFISGVGSLLGSGLLTLLSLPSHGWMHCPEDYRNINNCHMDYYFFLLAGIQLVTCLLFVWLSLHYEKQPWQPDTCHHRMEQEED